MPLFSIILIVAMVGMWWFTSRAQKKQQQERQNQLNSMTPGAQLVTIGGLHGVLSEVNTDKNTVIIDCEGIFLEFDRTAIRTVKPAPLAPEAEVTETEEIVTVEAPEVTEETENKK